MTNDDLKSYVDKRLKTLEESLLKHIDDDARIHTEMLVKINASLMEYIDNRMASTRALLKQIHPNIDTDK